MQVCCVSLFFHIQHIVSSDGGHTWQAFDAFSRDINVGGGELLGCRISVKEPEKKREGNMDYPPFW
jgi:hypothetical protein